MQFFVDSILYSYAQIFFSNRRWFGAIVLAATLVMPSVGLLGLLGVIVTNTFAFILKFDETKIKTGFYGFNGILFGAAAALFFKLTFLLLVLSLLFILITFFVSAVLEHSLASLFNLPGMSIPFIITLYMFFVFLTNFDGIEPAVVRDTGTALLAFLPDTVLMYFKSLGLILLQPDAMVGLVFCVSLLFLSRVMFILSIVGFMTAIFTLDVLFWSPTTSLTIIAGYNSILTAFALGGCLIIPSRKSLLLTIVSSVVMVIVAGFFTKLLAPSHLPVLVLPFNVGVLSVIYSLKFRREQSDLVLLYFLPGTPEENYYYHHNRVSRFEKFKDVVPELPFFGEWQVTQGHDGEQTHQDKWRWAWDFVVSDEQGADHAGTGSSRTDYYCYKLPVIAPLDGTVVRIVDGVQDNVAGDVNLHSNWGNTVVLDHGHGIYSSLSHLEESSIKVMVGSRVKKGDVLGTCGSSGRSPTPHLHFQFQATEKVGDRTLEYPFGHYISRRDGKHALHSFDHPVTGMHVRNVEADKTMRRAFTFAPSDMLTFHCTLGSEIFQEEWQVKVDISNTLFIESSRNATAAIATAGKVFYLTNFVGSRKSALYYFYLTAAQVPLCHEPPLRWTDNFPLFHMLTTRVRFVSELFLVFKPLMRATAEFSFVGSDSMHSVVCSDITVRGSGLFAFYRRRWEGKLSIDGEGNLESIHVEIPDNRVFHATSILSEGQSR